MLNWSPTFETVRAQSLGYMSDAMYIIFSTSPADKSF